MDQQVTYRGRPKVPNGVAPGATVLGGPDDDVKGPCAFMHGLCAHREALRPARLRLQEFVPPGGGLRSAVAAQLQRGGQLIRERRRCLPTEARLARLRFIPHRKRRSVAQLGTEHT